MKMPLDLCALLEAMLQILKIGNGKIILGLGSPNLIIPLQERSVNKCGFMRKN